MSYSYFCNNIKYILLGWGATDKTGEQSRYLRQVNLSFNSTSDCDCKDRYRLETNVGPGGEDPCAGDSGLFMLRIFLLSKFLI